MEDLINKYSNQDCYIVAKGPSLKNLKKSDIGKGVVITINDAIAKVEDLNIENDVYAMEKDGPFGQKVDCSNCSKCPISIQPTKSALLVHKHESLNCNLNYKPRYVFDNLEMGLEIQTFSAISAIKIGELMGCKKFYLISFDACTLGDSRTYVPGKNPEKTQCSWSYSVQCGLMRPYLEKIDFEWVTPK